MSIDKTELDILRLIQENAKISAKEISSKIGSPITTIYSRINKLEESGVIIGYKPVLDEKKLGFMATAFLHAKADLSQVDLLTTPDYSIGKELAKLAYVLEVFTVSGEYDYIIKLRAKDIEALGEKVLTEISSIKGLSSVRSSMVFRKNKETTDLPL